MLRWRITDQITKLFKTNKQPQPVILKRRRHSISRKLISPYAIKILHRLHKAGYEGYLVGGGVRDILLKKKPKDFDLSTNARPEQIRAIFRNSRIIGKRFLLVHIYFPGEVIEVSTFRAEVEEFTHGEQGTSGLKKIDNTYGTIEEDAWRRDFTINALYYNIADFTVIDYTGGINDLKRKIIRIIGNPAHRYHEDPVRILRCIRMATKLNFKIHSDTEAPLKELMRLLRHVPPSRLFDEILKLFFEGSAAPAYKKLHQHDFIKIIFPYTAEALELPKFKTHEKLIKLTMQSIDNRYHQGQPLNPGFLFSVLLWPGLQLLVETHSLHDSVQKILLEQKQLIALPRRITGMVRSVWTLQYHLIRRRPQRIAQLARLRYFRAALDFLELRFQSGEGFEDLVKWWRLYQQSSPKECKRMIDDLAKRT